MTFQSGHLQSPSTARAYTGCVSALSLPELACQQESTPNAFDSLVDSTAFDLRHAAPRDYGNDDFCVGEETLSELFPNGADTSDDDMEDYCLSRNQAL